MPVKFDKMGIAFQYPDNWTLDEKDALAGEDSVTVYSPGGAFWSVAVRPRTASPEQLAQEAVDALRQEYSQLDAERVKDRVAGCDMVGYDLSFYFLDLIVTAEVRAWRTRLATYTIFCQAEDREFDQLRPVFDAMATSLISETAG
jgi:hypothetical protein